MRGCAARYQAASAPRVIAHGGLADVVAGVTPCIDVVDSNLLLRGLRIAFDRLRAQRDT